MVSGQLQYRFMKRLAAVMLLLSGSPPATAETQLPAYLLQLPASLATVLVAETDTSTLHRFTVAEGRIQHHDERYMSIGQNGVGKQRPWDRRTPLGIYFVVEQLDTSKMHERYGPTAFPLDYPNIWDRRNRRGGDGIWIHGVTPNSGRRPPRDTDGCIALPNDELLAIEDQLLPTITPVIVTRQIRWQNRAATGDAQRSIGAALEAWETSHRQGDLHRYLSLYADDFVYRGMNRADWSAYRLQSFRNAPVLELELSDVLILADPEEEGLYLTRFQQRIVTNDQTITTTKRLYWRRNDDGGLKIIAEDNG